MRSMPSGNLFGHTSFNLASICKNMYASILSIVSTSLSTTPCQNVHRRQPIRWSCGNKATSHWLIEERKSCYLSLIRNCFYSVCLWYRQIRKRKPPAIYDTVWNGARCTTMTPYYDFFYFYRQNNCALFTLLQWTIWVLCCCSIRPS